MRVLVHGASVAAGSRLGIAAQGLALRGHRVVWAGGAPPLARAPDLEVTAGGLEAARSEADVVLGSGAGALGAAAAGWLARARAQVLALEGAELTRWDWRRRWAWASLWTLALLEPAQAERLAHGPLPVPAERLALWPDGERAGEPAAEHPDTEILERACERALARQRGQGVRSAAFLDRDGTLVVERGYLSDPADLELLPGAADAVRALHAAGLAVVVISNQSGVGRGLFPLARVHQAMAALRRALRARGAELDAIYFCPHRPEEGCDCRKPGSALLLRAAEDLQLDLRRSAMVGDKLLDVETGHRAGGVGALVRTGYGRDEEGRLASEPASRQPDRVSDDLADAAAWIVATLDLDRPA